MITYQEELFDAIAAEVTPLLFEHWEELANHKDDRPLDPDFEMYSKLSNLGIVKIFTVRSDGKLIGYADFTVAFNLHYKSWKYAACDVYYLDPEYRFNGVGSTMIQEIESWLKSLQVNSFVMHFKVNHPHAKFFERQGMVLVEQHYEKVI